VVRRALSQGAHTPPLEKGADLFALPPLPPLTCRLIVYSKKANFAPKLLLYFEKLQEKNNFEDKFWLLIGHVL
jgi:hypothetical protein